MNKYTYEGSNQVLIERFLLLIHTINSCVMTVFCAKQENGTYGSLFILAGIAFCWLLHVAKSKTYEFRAGFCAVVMHLSIIIYSGYMGSVSRILPMFMVFTVLLGLYGIEKLLYTATVATVLLYTYHGAILHTFSLLSAPERSDALLQAANVFFLQYIVYMWTKRNAEGSKRLLNAIDELKEMQSSKDDFLANVSHEFRTPINTICGMSELVLKEELPLNIKNNIRDIDLAGRNLSSIVRDILDFSELQSGNMELEEESYNITSTVNDIINMAMARRQGKRVEIIVDCAPDIPCMLLGDEKKLRRSIMNVVDNAVKFTNAGCVFIGIHFRRESYGINLIVTIRDTGIGMTEENLERIFTSFNQVDSSRKRQEGGLGLGLAITNALINKMNGALTIKSKPGKGTTVRFTVPQKVLNEEPIVSVKDKGKLNIATYIDMEQFPMVEIRDEYAGIISSLADNLNEKTHICRSMAELQRREEKEKFTHVFTSIMEYITYTAYFDKLAERTNVVIILDNRDEKYVTNPKLLKIYKPFYILSIVSVLNGLYDIRDERHAISGGKFMVEGAHVLAVDDNLTNLRVIEGLLGDYHIKVTTAASGKEALEKVVSMDYDFIFMDHMMPEMDGAETMKRIRGIGGTYFQKVPIIALTADAVAGTREFLLGEGFSDFLEKPVERSVLERVLKRNIVEEKFVYIKDELRSEVQEELSMEEEQSDDIEVQLQRAGLDVEKGSLYCNGVDKLIQVIEGFLEDYAVSVANVKKLYHQRNWKEYTIAVHGIKGAMASIGATKVSEMAKQLELAGKEERIKYILAHHEELLQEYETLYHALNACLSVPTEEGNPECEMTENKEEAVPLLTMEVERLTGFLEELEGAAYDLEQDKMLQILEELQGYCCNGTALKELFAPVKRKVEQSDCISAAELAIRLKEKLAGKEE
ncbi:MAG: response regulator [Lachnospiraceae bacterium]|nr:response regulator [Lachnospiraceae bacterium]